MEIETRNQRITAALEEEFQSCHELLAGALAHIAKQGSFEAWQMRNLMGLMRTTAQLAATINKLGGSPPAQNSENRGSMAILYLINPDTTAI
jgi:hypothetical protein